MLAEDFGDIFEFDAVVPDVVGKDGDVGPDGAEAQAERPGDADFVGEVKTLDGLLEAAGDVDGPSGAARVLFGGPLVDADVKNLVVRRSGSPVHRAGVYPGREGGTMAVRV
jgi:hypothetical protein